MDRDFAVHDRQVQAVAKACFNMIENFVPEGFTVEALTEGLLKGAAMVILADPRCRPEDAAEVFEAFADALRQPVS
jgi:hypothetical protein